jgi:nitrite reductase/ring-hydroxylating ferredoxin subunit
MCHGSIFDLQTGEAVGPPAAQAVPVYEVRVEGNEIQVAVPAT